MTMSCSVIAMLYPESGSSDEDVLELPLLSVEAADVTLLLVVPLIGLTPVVETLEVVKTSLVDTVDKLPPLFRQEEITIGSNDMSNNLDSFIYNDTLPR